MSSKDNFGDRMKDYERLETEQRFMPLLPIYARIDGQGFSKFTKGFAERPFDAEFHKWMVNTVRYLVRETGARIGYTQSDEISLVWYQENPQSEMWFARKKQKMVSSLAAKATMAFNREMLNADRLDLIARGASFDARVFQLPNLDEAANAVLWREQDATKNAISMAAHNAFSHKALQGKTGKEMQAMLLAEKDINFNDYPTGFRRGTFVRREQYVLDSPEYGSTVRHQVTAIDMPKFSSVANRTDVVFNGAMPILKEE